MKSSARAGLLRLAGFGGGEGGLPAFMPEYNKTSGIRSNRCGFRLFRVLSFVSRASGFARIHAASFQIRDTVHNSLSNQGVG